MLCCGQKEADSLKRLIAADPDDSTRTAHSIILAACFNRFGLHDSAEHWANMALINAQKLQNKYLVSGAHAVLGVTLYYHGSYQKALEHYLAALKIEEALGRKAKAANLYNNIGAIYIDQRFYELAENSYQKGSALYNELKDTTGMMHSSLNLGNLYSMRSQGEEDSLVKRALVVKAIEYNSLTNRYANRLSDSTHIANSLANLGQNYMYLQDYRQAMNKLRASIQILRRLDFTYDLGISLLQLSDVLLRTQKYDEAQASLEEALMIGRKLQNPEIVKYAYMNLAESYAIRGEYEKAFSYHKLFSALSDSILNTASTRQMQELQIAFDTEKKEKENALLQEKNNNALKTIGQQRLIGIAIGLICLLLVGFAYMIFRANREKQRINLQLERKNAQIEKQKELVEEKQKEILDSIHYARRIQRSLLTSEKYMERVIQKLRSGQPRDLR